MKNTEDHWYILPFAFQHLFVCFAFFESWFKLIPGVKGINLTLNLKGYQHKISLCSVNTLLNSVVTRIKDMIRQWIKWQLLPTAFEMNV